MYPLLSSEKKLKKLPEKYTNIKPLPSTVPMPESPQSTTISNDLSECIKEDDDIWSVKWMITISVISPGLHSMQTKVEKATKMWRDDSKSSTTIRHTLDVTCTCI